MKPRSAVIIMDVQNFKVLLIHRFSRGREYYTLPGGKIEPGETPAQACLREAKEETGLTITLDRQIAELENLGRTEHYFLAGSYSGRLELGSPERDYQTPTNRYILEWVALKEIDHINLLPVDVREMVKKSFPTGKQTDFSENSPISI
jgi:8-oxo-dGTP diphosphatase